MRSVLFMMYDMHCGGVEKALVELLKVLRQKTDWQIDLLLLTHRGDFLELMPDGIRVMQCDLPLDIYLETTNTTREALGLCLKARRFGTAFRLLRDWLLNWNKNQQQILQRSYAQWERRLVPMDKHYDLAVDFQGMGVFTTFYVSRMVSARKKATWIHNDISVFPEDMSWQRGLYQNFDKVFCVSGQAREKTAEKLPFLTDKLDVFYNILSREEILQKADETADRLEGDMKILSIGRLSYEKGYDLALRAMKELADAGYDFRYYIVGDGEDRQMLHQLVQKLGLQEQVRFLGFRMNPYPYLKQCDIYFQPSRFEGFCITLGEAKILDKPIITTDFAGAREQITDGQNGLLIGCDQRQMADTLKRMIDDCALRKQLCNNLSAADSTLVTDWNKLLME